MKTHKSSIIRGIGYSLIFFVAAWIIFMVFMHTPIWDSGYTNLGCLGIWFLIAVPFYFILKNDCNALYLLMAVITLFVVSITFTYLTLILDTIFPRSFVSALLPHWYGWSGLVYILPTFGIPFIGAIPIAIDAVIYLFKWIWKLLGDRKSI